MKNEKYISVYLCTESNPEIYRPLAISLVEQDIIFMRTEFA
jgi:hypothetical protein